MKQALTPTKICSRKSENNRREPITLNYLQNIKMI